MTATTNEGGPAARGLPPLPTFLIIGAQKSATRWLRSNLAKHPDVFAPDTELMYFSNRTWVEENGIDWYRAQFTGWDGERLVGEATPSYMAYQRQPQRMAARIADAVPSVRLIALLRNPIDRAYSALVHHVKHGRFDRSVDLVELAASVPAEKDRLGIIAGGWYATSLAPYRERFGDQLLVFLYDDVVSEPARVYADSLGHIGASADFVPTDLRETVYSNQQRSDLPPRPTDEQRRLLYATYFEDEINRTAEMIGRDLSAWRPQ